MSTTVTHPSNPAPSRATLETSRVLQAELKARINGEVRFDRTSRMLYATDASNYQIEPVGVVIPRSMDDAIGAIELAVSHGVPILPRGGGSSLAGQTVGSALVIDFSKYLNRVHDVDISERTVLVEPGSTITGLNRRLRQHGLMYGPDPASANRATVGGVIGNNSTGSHSILYGMTADNVIGVRAALATGGIAELGHVSADTLTSHAAADDPRGRLLRDLLAFRNANRDLIARDFPRHWRRATGYSLDEMLKPDGEFNPARLLVSSEGTLATVLQARLKLVPIPTRTALVLLQFADLEAAMEATPLILETEPSAVELMDRMLIQLTREQPGYADRISYIQGDPAGILAVEFYGDTDGELTAKCERLEAQLAKHRVPMNVPPLRMFDPAQQADVWAVRKDALGLLYSIRGDYKTIPVIEDVSVPVEHLPEYVTAVQAMCERHKTAVAFYAHASAGCLHVRPLIDLKTADGVRIMTEMAHEAAELAHRFGGVMSGEHGDGLQRSELNEVIFGSELYQAMREFKAIFDPDKLMNPGKIVDAPPMTDNLRLGPVYQPIQIQTHLDFSREGGFMGAVEMCNGQAVCRKLGAGTMCPSYMATKDENDTTRGRANALRNALAGNIFEPGDFTTKATYEVMDLCISCKACKTECPSSVDMTKIKAEYLAHYYEANGTPRRAKFFSKVHTLSRLGSTFAPFSNWAFKTPLSAPMMRAIGIHPDRKLSPFTRNTFVKRWKKHQQHAAPNRPNRGAVVYFHDTYAMYNYPKVGMAAVALLEAAGFEVIVEERRACCGRPAFSKGILEDARRSAQRNVELLAPYAKLDIPIVGTEASCMMMLRDEYVDLLHGTDDAKLVSKHSYMIDEFLAKLEAEGTLGINWKRDGGDDVFFHGHCHQKALIGMKPSMAILKAAGVNARESGAGCCGMAGSFGYEIEHYEVSKKIGEERLFPSIEKLKPGTTVAIAGVSCHQQIDHFTGHDALHIAEVLASRIDHTRPWSPPPATEAPPAATAQAELVEIEAR